MIKALSSFDLDSCENSHINEELKTSGRKVTEIDHEGNFVFEEQKNEGITRQERNDLQENFADEIMFNKIAFEQVKKPNLSVFGNFSNLKKVSSVNENLYFSQYFINIRIAHSKSPASRKFKNSKKEKLMIVCRVDYDSILEPNKQIYIPGLGLKKDLGIKIIDVKDIKDVSFWANNVFWRIFNNKRALIL